MPDSPELNNVALQVERNHLDDLNFPCIMLTAVYLLTLQPANISTTPVRSDTRCAGQAVLPSTWKMQVGNRHVLTYSSLSQQNGS